MRANLAKAERFLIDRICFPVMLRWELVAGPRLAAIPWGPQAANQDPWVASADAAAARQISGERCCTVLAEYSNCSIWDLASFEH
jgi:hypothetical protein